MPFDVKLKGRLYSTKLPFPRNVDIRAQGLSSKPQLPRYPFIESVMDFCPLQSHIHDVFVHFVYRGKLTTFRVFFKRHILLPINPRLGIHGDIVVMRVAASNRDSVVNLRPSDFRVADKLLEMLVF